MEFSEYQKRSRETAIYPDAGNNFVYPALGLPNEAGEVAGKIKKILRDADGEVSDGARKEIGKELGDVLWYMAQLASELQLNLDDIAQENLGKLASRKERGALGGSGDER